MTLRTAAIAGITIALVVVACGGEGSRPAPDVTTVDDAYQALAAGLQARRSVLHTTITTDLAQGNESEDIIEVDIWLDAGRGVGRQEYVLPPDFEGDLDLQGVTIFDGRYAYFPDDPDEALRQDIDTRCPESDSILISVLLGCALFPMGGFNALAVSLETDAQYEGTSAIVLVFHGRSAPGSTTFETRVYLDASTMLPIARITLASSPDEEVEIVSRFEHEYVPRGSLAEDFFDPRSIGYGIRDASGQLDVIESQVSVYWLGEDVDLDGSNGLVLARVETQLTFPPDEGPYPEGQTYGLHLYYETPSGVPGVYVFLWTPADWARYTLTAQGKFLVGASCAQSEPITVSGTEGISYDLIAWRAPIAVNNPQTDQERCEQQYHELWMIPYGRIAVIEFEDVVVDVRSDVGGYIDEPEPFESVLAVLHRRQLGGGR
ncbi:MAG: hypothetical protein IH865_04640 [Chloroflexi bacterium]|nr:hypothetical protein [Chloroflexota bacterium]